MSPSTATKRVAIYTRISDDSEGDGLGVTRQKEDCLARVEREQWQLVEVYPENDTGASTRSRKPRPKYAAMIEAVKAGEIDVILAYSNSRLTRRPMELEDLITLHEKTGVRVCTIVSGDDDLSTADGQTMARLKAAIDAGESLRTGERVSRKQRERRAQGGQGTKRAFGWQPKSTMTSKGPQRLADVLHPLEGKALKQGIKMILENKSLADVARFWNSSAILTVSGNPWTTTRTKEVLTRWRNAGLIVHLKEPTGEVGTWKPVCTVQELEQVRAMLNSNPAPRGRQPAALLSGLMTCGRCFRSMTIGKQKGGRKKAGEEWVPVYRCSGSQSLNGDKCFLTIRRDTAEAVVVNAVAKRVVGAHPSDLPTTPETSRLRTLYAARNEVHGKVGVLVEALLSGSLKPADVSAARALLEKEEVALQMQIDFILTKNAQLALSSEFHVRLFTSKKASFVDAVAARADVRGKFLNLSLADRRIIVKSLGLITVQPGRSADRVTIA